MNRFFQIFNFLGVCLLSVLCCVQWSGNRQFDLRLGDMQVQNDRLANTIAEQARTIAGNTADLNDFRHRLSQANDELSQAQGKIAAMTAERNRVAAERDQLAAARDHLKTILSKWIAAVTARDAVIKQASVQILQLAGQRNDAIVKFNDLAGRYNALSKQLDSSPSRP